MAMDVQLSTGVPGLDRLLRGLIAGDNLVWQVDAIEHFAPFVPPYCRHALGRGKRITHPSEVLAEGQSIAVRIEKIDRDAKRISLTLLDDDEEEKAEELEDFQKYVGKAPGSFGSLGDALQKKLAAADKK